MSSLIVMGVAGCGKSTLGAEVASELGWPMIEGDDFHPTRNIEKMRSGIALTDADRIDWLAALCHALQAASGPVVLSCSALRRAYRDQLRRASPGLRFVYLALTVDEARRRVGARAGTHPFAASLVDSQFAVLESPSDESGVLTLDATAPVALLTQQANPWCRVSGSHGPVAQA